MISDEVCTAAIETLLKPLGTSLRHYMPASKAAAIEAMRCVLMAERERAASIADGWLTLFGESGAELKHTTPQRWANDAVADIADAIRFGAKPETTTTAL